MHAPGFAPRLRTLTVFPGMGSIEFYLARGRVLRGVVADESGRPIAGARISGLAPFDHQTRTDSEGRFVWHSAPTKPVPVHVTAEGYQPATPVLLDPAGPDTRITLRHLQIFEVRGHVYDGDTGAAIPEFKVRVSSGFTDPRQYAELRPAISGHHGSFVLHLQDRIKSYCLETRADGYIPEQMCGVESALGNRGVPSGSARVWWCGASCFRPMVVRPGALASCRQPARLAISAVSHNALRP